MVRNEEGILKGIRVIDFTDFLAGPYIGMYFADMGADVVKFENLTSGGNFVRNAAPLEKKSGISMYFQNLNRNKRGVALDLKKEEGKKLFAKLIKSADVLIENNRPGVMKRLGFSWEECKELNPRLIYASISGFGQYGPNSYRPGYDLIAQAMGGSMSITGWPGMEPTRAGMAIGDMFAGLNAGFAICASLFERQKSGKGNHIDVALVDSIFSGMEAKMMQYVYTGKSPEKTGNKYISSAPYDSFKAKDDYFVIASGTDKHFQSLSTAMGMPELHSNPLYIDTESRKKNADSLKVIIEKWASDKTVNEVVKIIDTVGVPVAPIYNCEQACSDKNIVEVREMLVKIPGPKRHPEIDELTVIGNPIKMIETPCRYTKAAPDLGEDNYNIFKELGYTDEELDNYKKSGVMN
ncbi:CaiB/BaiF CoA transferase family protein [Fusobacterium animalis]|uniref:CaiB/BaiF CoA transferase family protein n=1 Tax=Fusobacterium animalis TaxID=76859 RepID=UPI001C6EAF37|nr:CoA transferase [Fusobacterium animalis]QYR64071.1 CoA transferase [Fusobacterium animalis]